MMAEMKGLLYFVLFFLQLLCSTHCAVAEEIGKSCAATDSNGTASNVDKIRLGLEWFMNPDHLPLIVAQDHGIFASLGLEVELVEPTDHWEAVDEILEGRLDIAVTEPLHLAHEAADGKPVLGFMRFLHTDGGVMYNADKVKRPSDMCGKTISYPGSPGPGGPAIVNTMVEADGKLDCPLDSYGKYNGGFYHTNAIKDGNADLATLIFWNFEIPEAQANNLNVGFFSLKEWGVPDFCQLIFMTTPDLFRARQQALRKLVLAMRKAIAVIHQTPDLAKDYYRKRFPVEALGSSDGHTAKAVQEATLTATLPAFPNDFMMANDYYKHLMRWLVDTNQVDQDSAIQTDPKDYWTNDIAW
ncbi:hypothetical protein ACA910_021409 [Epithemia clementina (nom. ined.)]